MHSEPDSARTFTAWRPSMLSSRQVLARAIAAALVVSPALLLMGARPAQPADVQDATRAQRLVVPGVSDPRLRPAIPGTTTASADADSLVIVTVHWRNRAQLRRIASKFQHVAVDDAQHTARVEASAEDLLFLRRLDVRIEVDQTSTLRMQRADAAMSRSPVLMKDGRRLTTGNSIPQFACYRTVEETYGTMDQLVALKPTLARVVD